MSLTELLQKIGEILRPVHFELSVILQTLSMGLSYPQKPKKPEGKHG